MNCVQFEFCGVIFNKIHHSSVMNCLNNLLSGCSFGSMEHLSCSVVMNC